MPTTLPLSRPYDRRQRRFWRVAHYSLQPSIGLLAGSLMGFSLIMLGVLAAVG